MTDEEARLRAMIEPGPTSHRGIDGDDRAAVRWALDAIDALKEESDEIQGRLNVELRLVSSMNLAIRTAIEQLVAVIGKP